MTGRAGVVVAAVLALAATVTTGGSSWAEVPSGEVSWVSTGDSYSSGEGVAGNQGACAQSRLAYGPLAGQLARRAGWDIAAEAFTACTGRLVEDLFNEHPGSQNHSLWDWGLTQVGQDPPEQPGAPYKVDLLTFSFGGNDIGFANLLLDCLPLPDSFTNAVTGFVRPDLADLSGCDTPEQEIDDRIAALLDPPRRDCQGGRQGSGADYDCDLLIDDLGNSDPGDDVRGSLADFYVYLANEHLTERGHVVVVGYPNLFAPVEEWPGYVKMQCQGVSRGDTERLARLAANLNDTLNRAVIAANDQLGRDRIHYLPRSVIYRDGSHELCGSGEDWLNGLDFDRGDGQFRRENAFHPNDAGHAATAEALIDLLEPITFASPEVVAVTSDGQPVPEPVLATAEAIHAAASDRDVERLVELAAAPDFTYAFDTPPGGLVPYWSAPNSDVDSMVAVLEQSVATDGSTWWWPAEWLTDETYYGYRIGIDSDGTWRFAVAGD